jgi:acetoin utilization protein AcuC
MPVYPEMARTIHDCARRFVKGGRWVATGGGGYQAETVVPKVWTIHLAEMCGRPDVIPLDWFDDVDPEAVARPHLDTIEASVEEVFATCLPRLRALAG